MPEFSSLLLNKCLCAMIGGWPRLVSRFTPEVDAIFVWGRADGEWEESEYDDGVLKCARHLYWRKKCPIVMPGYTGVDQWQSAAGYAGPQQWAEALVARGIPRHLVIPVPGGGHTTKTEMDDFLSLAQEFNWQTIMAVTQPAHMLRAMLGTVRSLDMLGLFTKLHVYPFYPARFDFAARCYGSQGEGPMSRLDWIDQEFERIPRYQGQGDLASLEELWAYLQLLYARLLP